MRYILTLFANGFVGESFITECISLLTSASESAISRINPLMTNRFAHHYRFGEITLILGAFKLSFRFNLIFD